MRLLFSTHPDRGLRTPVLTSCAGPSGMPWRLSLAESDHPLMPVPGPLEGGALQALARSALCRRSSPIWTGP